MNEEQLDTEFEYRVAERLGILCGTNKPTPDEVALARQEAELAIEELKSNTVTL